MATSASGAMLFSRDELDLRACCASSSGDSSSASGIGPSGASGPFAASEGACGDAGVGGGPLSTLRRSLRQLNPFKSRLFRLPATPRLSRSKKVLARGEEFTGWNFERPASASLRPFGSSFGSADVPFGGVFRPPPPSIQPLGGQPTVGRRRLSQMVVETTPLQPSPMQLRRRQQHQQQQCFPQASISSCHCYGHQNNNEPEGPEGEELNEFLSAMESIARRGVLVGGSCRAAPEAGGERRAMVRGTVAGGGGTGMVLPGPGTRRARPPIPTFAPPPSGPVPPGNSNNRALMANGRQRVPPLSADEYQFLPSTCYAADGEMYAARWHPSGVPAPSASNFPPSSPRAPLSRHSRRPAGLLLDGSGGHNAAPGEQPKSPSLCSAITLLNTSAPALSSARGMRSASTSSQHQQKQTPRPLASVGLFPQTQLQRRRSAAAAGGSAGGGIAEEEQPAEGANYYGREVIRMMREEEADEEGMSTRRPRNAAEDEAPPSLTIPGPLLPVPSPLFPFPDELCLGGRPLPLTAPASSSDLPSGAFPSFVGREWLFRELCHHLTAEHAAPLIVIRGASGCGKSAALRHIVAHSHFGGAVLKADTEVGQKQHNTVDSGIAVGGGGTSSSAGSGNSSGSQLSLLNLTAHPALALDPVPASPDRADQHDEWLATLSSHLVAFHFAHLHNALSCSVAEFVRSLCAQMCACPQLRHSYGKMIRSDQRLHQLATQECRSLQVEPLELFNELISRPLAKLYREEEEASKRRAATKASTRNSRRRSPSGTKCGGSSSDYGSGERPQIVPLAIAPNSPHSPSPSSVAGDCCVTPLPNFLLVLMDALDEADFHRTDGGECIGWLLRRVLATMGRGDNGGDCCAPPPQLRFVCTVATDQQLSEWGSLESRSIRLDDWEADERVARDLRLFVERRVQASPALDKWVGAQFRRQNFFSATPLVASGVGDFASQLVAHLRGNFVALQLALSMLAEGRALSLDSLPRGLDQLYSLHFRHKFPNSTQFQLVAPILGILLASLRPLCVDEMVAVLGPMDSELDELQIRERLSLLSPLVVPLASSNNSVFVPAHPSIREWLLSECVGPEAEFRVDIRTGHILLALSLVRRGDRAPPASPEQLFELAHHLLKANPHKYMPAELAARLEQEIPAGRDAQLQWLRRAATGESTPERGMACALLCRRNIHYSNAKVSRLLLLAGADPNCTSWSDGGDAESLLCAFVRANNPEMVRLLLQFGADPALGSPSPLIIAVQHDHAPVARELCAGARGRAALFAACDAAEHGALWHAAARDALGMVTLLMDVLLEGGKGECKKPEMTANGAEGDESNQVDRSPMAAFNRRYSACSSSYDEETRGGAGGRGEQKIPNPKLMDNNSQGSDGINNLERAKMIREAFEVAAEHGSAQVCRYLLDNTDPAMLDTSRAMCIACANGRSEVVQFLLSRGATLVPGAQQWSGKSALVCAVESGSWDLVVSVLNNGASGDAEGHELNRQSGPDRITPLMVAARHGHVGLVDLLVNRGAHLDAADAHGRTAAMHAIEAGHSSTVALLLERGCALHARDSHGNTMLHLLARHPNKCLINRLLEAGLPLEDKNREDLRPIEVAIRAGQLLAVDTFLRRGARLRSLTWHVALASHPPLVLVLFRKLLDDAHILLRRKRCAEAQHRFSYALQKCEELLGRADAGDRTLRPMRTQLRQIKMQTLHSMACMKRRCNDLREAISLASQALDMLGDADNGSKPGIHRLPSCSSGSAEEDEGEPETALAAAAENDDEQHALRREEEQRRFELHLLRAKCHFDARDLDRARVDAKLAACLRPGDAEAQNLVAVLSAG